MSRDRCFDSEYAKDDRYAPGFFSVDLIVRGIFVLLTSIDKTSPLLTAGQTAQRENENNTI